MISYCQTKNILLQISLLKTHLHYINYFYNVAQLKLIKMKKRCKHSVTIQKIEDSNIENNKLQRKSSVSNYISNTRNNICPMMVSNLQGKCFSYNKFSHEMVTKFLRNIDTGSVNGRLKYLCRSLTGVALLLLLGGKVSSNASVLAEDVDDSKPNSNNDDEDKWMWGFNSLANESENDKYFIKDEVLLSDGTIKGEENSNTPSIEINKDYINSTVDQKDATNATEYKSIHTSIDSDSLGIKSASRDNDDGSQSAFAARNLDELTITDPIELKEAAALTHAHLLRQAAGVAADAHQQLLLRAYRALAAATAAYSESLHSVLDILEYSLKLTAAEDGDSSSADGSGADGRKADVSTSGEATGDNNSGGSGSGSKKSPRGHGRGVEAVLQQLSGAMVGARASLDQNKCQYRELQLLVGVAAQGCATAGMAALLCGCEATVAAHAASAHALRHQVEQSERDVQQLETALLALEAALIQQDLHE